ncbi:tetrahydrofolate synthase [Segatella salivae]|uniref:tetrahydrofolate synthase n=1 Tax=Segatella salivae TaxID=228604 RepID=UPI001C5EF94A|nr:tetrahydrofolate synthase [Segatella salivae]
MQRHWVHAPFPINISGIINAFATQCHKYCGKFSMNESLKMIILNLQRRRCCSFDSPGLARNKPTLGKWLQGDSTL